MVDISPALLRKNSNPLSGAIVILGVIYHILGYLVMLGGSWRVLVSQFNGRKNQ
jgi:hypothetical protein